MRDGVLRAKTNGGADPFASALGIERGPMGVERWRRPWCSGCECCGLVPERLRTGSSHKRSGVAKKGVKQMGAMDN